MESTVNGSAIVKDVGGIQIRVPVPYSAKVKTPLRGGSSNFRHYWNPR